MTATEHAEIVIAKKARRDWLQLVTILIIIGLLFWITWDKAAATERAHVAEAKAQTFAQEVQKACASDADLAAKYGLCTRADDVAAEVVTPSNGINGERGERGEKGDPSTVPGPMGPAGLFTQGADSTVPGPRGEQGATGAASTVAGPAGADSTVPGPAGADSTVPGPAGDSITGATGADSTVPGPAGADSTVPGPAGASGVGLASIDCGADGNWIVTFTDDTTTTVAGPCRVATTPTEPEVP